MSFIITQKFFKFNFIPHEFLMLCHIFGEKKHGTKHGTGFFKALSLVCSTVLDVLNIFILLVKTQK